MPGKWEKIGALPPLFITLGFRTAPVSGQTLAFPASSRNTFSSTTALAFFSSTWGVRLSKRDGLAPKALSRRTANAPPPPNFVSLSDLQLPFIR